MYFTTNNLLLLQILWFYSSSAGARSISGIFAGRYEAGTGPIYLDEVRCRGTESALIECTSNGLGVHNCGHSSDAGVSCEGKHKKEDFMHTHTHHSDNSEVISSVPLAMMYLKKPS